MSGGAHRTNPLEGAKDHAKAPGHRSRYGPDQGALETLDAGGKPFTFGAFDVQLVGEPIPFGTQRIDLSVAAALSAQRRHRGGRDEGALRADRPDGLPVQAPGFQVTPDRSLGDGERLGGLGNGKCMRGIHGRTASPWGARLLVGCPMTGRQPVGTYSAGLRWISMFH